jgi:hypothetical protein
MTVKLFTLIVGVMLVTALTGCGSLAGGGVSPSATDTPVAGGAEQGSDTMNNSTPDETTPDPSDGITLDNGGGVTMRVLWTISGYTIGKGAAWGEQEAKALLFKPLDMNDSEIIFDGKACQGVNFQQETVNAADYLSNVWKTTPQELGIDNQELQVFKTNCSLSGFQEYMRLPDGHLIVPINGVFFFFEPAVAR